MKLKNVLTVLTLATFMFCTSIFATEKADKLATPWMTESFISFEPNVDAREFHLEIFNPAGEMISLKFDGTEAPYFQLEDLGQRVEGLYTFQITATPNLSDIATAWMLEQREAGEPVTVANLREQGFIGNIPMVMNGNFRILHGEIMVPTSSVEEVLQVAASKTDLTDSKPADGEPNVVTDQDGVDRAQVFTTDVIVDGSQCVGMDCTSSESFGSDTIRLKENNLRIKFDDTSSSGSFPNNDWTLQANESGNGGENHFALIDSTGNKTPFKIVAGAPTNALTVDSAGDVGIGTADGILELHIKDGDSPGIRIEQDGSSGWQSQIWDIAGNETNFFVRDVTNSSQLPFKILPGADHNSLVIHGSNRVGAGTANPSARMHINSNTDAENIFYVQNAQSTATYSVPLYVDSAGEVGVGTSSPSALLHVSTDTGSTSAVIEDTNATLADRNLFYLKNKGGSRIELVNTNLSDKTWQISNPNNRDYLQFTLVGSGNAEMTINESGDLDVHNNITAGGTVTGSSDRNIKENFKNVSHQDILDRVADIEILEWNYISDKDEIRHIGPMAQDFHAAFGMGIDNKHISMVDMDGIALASIKALNEKVEDKNAEITALKAQNEELAAKLSRIEELLQRMEK
jgi:hypothetical protein